MPDELKKKKKKTKKRKKVSYRPTKLERLAAKEMVYGEIQTGTPEYEKTFAINSQDFDVLNKAALIMGMSVEDVIRECVNTRLGYITRLKKRACKDNDLIYDKKGFDVPFTEKIEGAVQVVEQEKPVEPKKKKNVSIVFACLIIGILLILALAIEFLIFENIVFDNNIFEIFK